MTVFVHRLSFHGCPRENNTIARAGTVVNVPTKE